MRYHTLASCSLAVVACVTSSSLLAQQDTRQAVRLPRQPLGVSLQQVAQIFGRNVSASADVVAGKTAKAVDANMTFEQALSVLLEGSGLEVVAAGSGAAVRPKSQRGAGEGEILVTGSRIRGAPVASTRVSVDRESMKDAGQSSAADVIRSIPQNFGGGQNPGIGGNVPANKGADLAGGSSINLRGLGSDATLTLLDGRRLSYDGAFQSVDVSAIPFGAIERIEIVPDGGSALFGSDAVAGVANIVLRRGYDGLETTARLAGSTDGGNFQQQYGATLGKAWTSGSIMAAYEFARSTPITADQRSYAASRSPGVTLYPYLRHHNAALTFRQEIVPDLTFDLVGLYNRRWQKRTLPLNVAGDLDVSRVDSFGRVRSWAVAPTLTWALPADWQVSLAGSYGWNKVYYGGAYVYGDTSIDAGSGTYRNVTENVELSGNGKLLELPGGDAKLAIGAGYRRNQFRRLSTRGVSQHVDEAQESYYAFGELSIPVFGGGNESRLGESLDLSLAGRFERYPGIASVLTPKLGAVYGVSRDVSLKGSWGRSFRAPTLYEQFTPATAYLATAATFGGSSANGETAILLLGGSRDLKPEKSTNWSVSLDIHPRGLAGARLEISYFNIHYRDRIVTPIPSTSRALSDPLYADRVLAYPDLGAQDDVLRRAATFTNLTSSPYDPANVSAIVDNTSINAGRQTVQGIDVLARYSFAVPSGAISTSLNASYIDSEQQIGPGQPVTPLAGTLFNPPHWRGRGELSWAGEGLTVTGAVNYIGPVRDTRGAIPVKVGGMVPVDLTIRYQSTPDGGLLGGIELIASAQNVFNDKPSPIATSLYIDTPYDSTNYSPFGRVLSLTVSKTW